MPLSEAYLASRRGGQRLPPREEGGGGGGTNAWTPRHPPLPPRPHTIDFSTTSTDLPPHHPSSHHHLSSSSSPHHPYTHTTPRHPYLSRWGSAGGVGGGCPQYGADPALLMSGTRSPLEGHSRLPSTDSGIQADGGWGDSLTRSLHRYSLGKAWADSPTSPDINSRAPLKTLTRCLMEPRGAGSYSSSWGDTSPSPSRPPRDNSGPSDVRKMTSDRHRTGSCDSDVRGGGEEGWRSRMMSSYPGGGAFHVHTGGQAPTTRGEEVGGRSGWKGGGESLMSRSMDSALSTSSVRTPLTSAQGSSIATSLGDRDRSGSPGTRSGRGPSSRTASHSESSAGQPDTRSEVPRTGRPLLLRSVSAQISPLSEPWGKGEEEAGQDSARAGGRYSSSQSAPLSLNSDSGRVSADSKSTTPLRLLSSSTSLVPSGTSSEGGRGSPQREAGVREVGVKEASSPDRRSSPQTREGASERNRLHRFRLSYPRISSSVSSGSTASPERNSSGQALPQDSPTRPSAGYHSRTPGMVSVPVTHLISSGGAGSLGRLRYKQLLHRPLRSSDLHFALNFVPSRGAPSVVPTSRSPSAGSAGRGSDSSSPRGSSLKVARVIPIQTSPPGRSQSSRTPGDQGQADVTVKASQSPSGSVSRPRHFSPSFRSKVSPVLARNTSPAKASLPHSPSPTCPGRPIPVVHVDTCRACLKPPTTAEPGSDLEHLPGQTQDSSAHTKDCSGNAASPIPGDLKVTDNAGPLAVVHPGALALQEGGEGGGRGEVPVMEVGTGLPWQERRKRMDVALAWLKTQLGWLRAMDVDLVTQFRRCQETVECLKQQQLLDLLAWGDGEGGDWGWGVDGSEIDQEEDVWEDWEIAEFERRWAENPDAREVAITVLPVTSPGAELNNVRPGDVTSPFVTSEERQKCPSPIQQDVEARV